MDVLAGMFWLIRPWASFTVVAIVFASYCLASNSPTLSWQVANLLVVLFLMTSVAFIFNDIADIAIDRTAHQERPLVAGLVSLHQASTAAWLLLSSALVLSLLISIYALGLAALLAILVVAYSGVKSRNGALGNVVTALMFGCTIETTHFIDSSANFWVLFGLSGFYTLLILAREIVKDIEDFDSDVQWNRRTLPIMFSPGLAFSASGLFLCGATIAVLTLTTLAPSPFTICALVLAVVLTKEAWTCFAAQDLQLAKPLVAQLRGVMLMSLLMIQATAVLKF